MNLKLEHIPSTSWYKPAKWKLLENFDMVGVTVPKDFITDGITSKFFLYWLLNPTGKGMRAAVVHDYLLSKYPKTRKIADDKFKEALQELDITKCRLFFMYYGVVLYGSIVGLLKR